MKVEIIVWDLDKPHDIKEGMPMTTILEYDEFKYPEIEGHGVPIERCKFDDFPACLKVYLDEYPARIDADPHFQTLHLIHKDMVEFHPDAYTILDRDKGKGIILWTNPNIEVEV